MGDITELGNIVGDAFAHSDQAGNGQYLPLVGDFMSFNEIVETLNRQGHQFSLKQVPKEVFATSFPGASQIAATFAYFEAHTYLGSDSRDRIALANKVAGRQPTKFATWARVNFPVNSREPFGNHGSRHKWPSLHRVTRKYGWGSRMVAKTSFSRSRMYRPRQKKP